jgi:hypothetical protein
MKAILKLDLNELSALHDALNIALEVHGGEPYDDRVPKQTRYATVLQIVREAIQELLKKESEKTEGEKAS